MLAAPKIADFAVVCARGAVDRLISFVQTDPPSFENAHDAEMALIESRHRIDDDHADRRTWENHAALSLLIGARTALYPDERAMDTGANSADGYRMLRDGDFAGASALAHEMLDEAQRTPKDDRNFGHLFHHGHVLRGKVYLAQGDLSASARELVAAGEIPGSPQLDSIGPDLSLAWALLKLDHDQAVLAYLKAIARLWSPYDLLGDQADDSKH